MFCDRCGTRLQETQRFCPGCGKLAGPVPLMPVEGRISGHVRLLGILWLAASAIHLLPGFFLASFFGGHHQPFAPDMPFFVRDILRAVGGVFLASGILGLIAGWGLLERRPWARMLAIILGCFHLVNPPFGTALGIYTLWVLLPAASEQEYRQMARVA
jgi:hypothetical protein